MFPIPVLAMFPIPVLAMFPILFYRLIKA
jgi:hypothetical protein